MRAKLSNNGPNSTMSTELTVPTVGSPSSSQQPLAPEGTLEVAFDAPVTFVLSGAIEAVPGTQTDRAVTVRPTEAAKAKRGGLGNVNVKLGDKDIFNVDIQVGGNQTIGLRIGRLG